MTSRDPVKSEEPHMPLTLHAKRDYSTAEFRRALKRNGFKHAALFWFSDTTGACPDRSFSGVFYRTGKCARRATVAKLIRDREAAIAEDDCARAA